MYIGTSLGKCVKSILDGEVNEDDVLFIVSNTMCPELDRVLQVMEEYHYARSYVAAYDMTAYTIEEVKAVAQRLFENGQLHQPRCFKKMMTSKAHNLRDTWYEIVPTNTSHETIVVEAYERYRILSGLMK